MFARRSILKSETFISKYWKTILGSGVLLAIAVFFFVFTQSLTAQAELGSLVEIQNDRAIEILDFVYVDGNPEPQAIDFMLILRNKEELDEASVYVEVVNFESHGRAGEISVRDNDYKWGAAQWITDNTVALETDRVVLSELAEGATNTIDFHVEPPSAHDALEYGIYRAAIMIRDQEDQLLARYIIVINLQSSTAGTSRELVASLADSSVDLVSGEVEITLENTGLWYIEKVGLEIRAGDDTKEFDLEQEYALGVFPETSQIFTLGDPKSLVDFVDDRQTDEWKLAIKANSSDSLLSLTIEDDGITHNNDQVVENDNSSGSDETTGATGQTPTSASEGTGNSNFFSKNPMLIAATGGVLVLSFVILFVVIRRRRGGIKKPKAIVEKKPNDQPAVSAVGSLAGPSAPTPAAANFQPLNQPSPMPGVAPMPPDSIEPAAATGPAPAPVAQPAATMPTSSQLPAPPETPALPQDKLASLPKIED